MQRPFQHFQTIVIAPMLSALSLNGRKARTFNSPLGISSDLKRANPAEPLQPRSQDAVLAKHYG